MNKKNILVTKSYLPPLDTYVKQLETLWESHWLTNDGVLLKELEAKLRDYLGVKHVFFVTNGTIAMQIALKALGVTREVITTPFSFPATPNVILWEGCSPVFADISATDMCIDPTKIEEAITPRTEAILAVHVYGNPCDVEKIDAIAKKHNLKVIYDAAHTFGATYKGKSLASYGDVATLSFHATKLFHTGEGGAIVTNDDAVAEKILRYRNFGWSESESNYIDVGINAKNSEFHAAMGLANLPSVPALIDERKKLCALYDRELKDEAVDRPVLRKNAGYNFAYYPVVFTSEATLLSVKAALEKENIYPRRYFYPSLNTLPYMSSVRCPNSESIAKRVLCLPLYNSLSSVEVKRIATIIKQALHRYERPTLTVGIPAHNEQGNIRNLLLSILKQKAVNYTLKNIIVTLDNCSDDTEVIVRGLQKRYPIVSIKNDGRRLGKVGRLNELYRKNKSDLLLTLDADVLLERTNEISLMVENFNDKRVQVVSANQEPVKPKGFLKNIIYYNYVLWNEVRKTLSSDHVANLYGSATMLRSSFAKTIRYPGHITADYDYLYLMTKKVDGFSYEPRTRVLYLTPGTIEEMRLVGTRLYDERNALVTEFGDEVLHMHSIPLISKLRGIGKCLIRQPIYTLLGILLTLWIRLVPKKDALNERGLWQQVTTTKQSVA